jgi:hypothetical protein
MFAVLAVCIILTAKFASSNEELIVPCGAGDNQTMIGCPGDNQTMIALAALPSNVSAISVTNSTNVTNVTNITINNVVVSGGGGGGVTYLPSPSSPTTTPTFTLSPSNFTEILKQGQVATESVIITNIGTQAADISILNQLGDLARLSTNSVNLDPGQSTTITIDFIASPTTTPNLYLGSIVFQSGSYSQSLFAALEVESANPLLDVAINLPSQYQQISPGDTMLAGITLYNLGSTFGDVSMNYIIEDDNGNVIVNQSDTVAIQTQTSYIKSLQIPSNAPLGNYILYVRANYLDKIASASTDFQIVYVSSNEKIYIIIITSLAIIIAGFIGYIIIKRRKRNYKQIKRVGLEDLLWR